MNTTVEGSPQSHLNYLVSHAHIRYRELFLFIHASIDSALHIILAFEHFTFETVTET